MQGGERYGRGLGPRLPRRGVERGLPWRPAGVFLFVPGLSAHTHVELPYYSKFLLIAAYLASYNPARTDKRFFLKV